MKMTALLLTVLSTLSMAHANEEHLRQLTQSEDVSEAQGEYDEKLDTSFGRTLKISPEHCTRARELRSLPQPNYPVIVAMEKLCYQTTYVDSQEKVVGFDFTNETKNAVNPMSEHGSDRSFGFRFPLRHSQNMHISITENAGLTGNMSHDLLETTIVLLPRKVIPSIEVLLVGEREIRRVQLPTAETIDFDTATNEIVDGVIVEAAMDMNPSRHARRFAGLNYIGRGLMIRVDRRAGTPEHIYTQSFNQHERIKDATVTYRGKTCYVPKNLIWANAHNADLGAYVLHASDIDFLNKVINPKCGWKLTLADLE